MGQGGYVEIHRGAWRVHGVLSVSRSIGDAHLKSWVLGEPDTTILHLTTDMEFLVLASDGLWEEVRREILFCSCNTSRNTDLHEYRYWISYFTADNHRWFLLNY